jgi:BirA family transcriptional regulator, biotin operon repressor / biotin---[acetyl-CoA-carboxylase] ligase
MRPGGAPTWAALRSFVAANALYSAIAMHARDVSLALKWPNDVLLAGGKVGGILLETTGQGATWIGCRSGSG